MIQISVFKFAHLVSLPKTQQECACHNVYLDLLLTIM